MPWGLLLLPIVPQPRTATYHPFMPLPILQSHPHASREDLIRYYHKIELHWARHLGEEAALDVGTAISNPELNKVHDANRLCDAALPEGLSPSQAWDMVQEHFNA